MKSYAQWLRLVSARCESKQATSRKFSHPSHNSSLIRSSVKEFVAMYLD